MNEKQGAVLSLQAREKPVERESTESTESTEAPIRLAHGRTLAVTPDGPNEVIEIRASSGTLELRIHMTEEGPMLTLEGVKLAVKAQDSIDMECKRFSVNASESVELASSQELKIKSDGELTIRSEGADVRVIGEKIYLRLRR